MDFLEVTTEIKNETGRKNSPRAVKAIDLLGYDDYRKFLRDFYNEKKLLKKAFSYRTFAVRAGLGSPSHFQMTVKGERNLSHKTIPKFIQALGLKGREGKYFEHLVLYNQAEDQDSKSQHFLELLKIRQGSSLHKLEKERFSFLSRWYIVATYALVEVRDFNADPLWIAGHLEPKISKREAEEALQVLEKLGMIKADAQRGYVQAVGVWNTDDDTQAVAVYNYHRQMITLALQALKTQRLSKREMNGVTISIPKDKLNVLKEKIRKFRSEVLELSKTFENPEEVYQLNIQLFSLTQEKL